VAKETKATLETRGLDVVADRGCFSSEQILACEEAGITVTLPKPMTSNSKAEGRFGKQEFRYLAEEGVYICRAGKRLAHSFTTEENGLVLRRCSTNACRRWALRNASSRRIYASARAFYTTKTQLERFSKNDGSLRLSGSTSAGD
jgi:hypothetical protein